MNGCIRVIGLNVYIMGQMSDDDGIFGGKLTICESNYILKLKTFKRSPWCEIWDRRMESFDHRCGGVTFEGRR